MTGDINPPTSAVPLRVGMVGAGLIAQLHAGGYRNLRAAYGDDVRDIRLVRIADVDGERARLAARELGFASSTEDWRRVTRAADVDVVDIVTPNDTHAEIAVDALRHGKPVLCEKPLSHDLDFARLMAETASITGLVNQTGFTYRFWPAIRLAKRIIERGDLGSLLTYRGHYYHDYAVDRQRPMSWRFERARAGSGALGDIGSHVIDTARFLVGDVTRVLARSHRFVERRPSGARAEDLVAVDVDDATEMWVELGDAVPGTLQVSWAATGYKTDTGFEVIGDRGAIRFSWERSNELLVYSHQPTTDTLGYRRVFLGPEHPGAAALIPTTGAGLGWRDVFLMTTREFVSAVSEGRSASPDFVDGLRAVEVIDAAQRSASRDWIELPGAAQA